MSFII